MPTRKEPKIPLSDVVQLLAGRKKATKRKKPVTRKRAVAPPPYVNPSQRYTGMSAFAFTPSMVNPTPPPFVQPLQQARGQTININTNYDPDRHRVQVETDSKSGIFPTEINPNDIAPRISQRRVIAAEPTQSLISSSLPPVSSRQEFSNPVAHLRQAPSLEVIPSAPYDPLRPGGSIPPFPSLDEEKYGDEMIQAEAMMPPLDPGNLETESQFEEFYPPPRKRLTKLTRKNPVTGQLEQYARGGILPMKDYPVNRYMDGGFVTRPYMDRLIIPPGNPRDHFRGKEHLLREIEA